MGYLTADAWFDIREPGLATAPRFPVFRKGTEADLINTIDLTAPCVVLEFEHLGFHHNSCVPLPCIRSVSGGAQKTIRFEDTEHLKAFRKAHPDAYDRYRTAMAPGGTDDSHDTRALVVLATAYRFLELHGDYRLLISGHTDSSGSDAVNFELSERRAENVLAILQGDAETWADNCRAQSTTEDVQRILKHYAHVNLWPCDPGPVDNDPGPVTTEAIRQFQVAYNALGHQIAEDGVVGKITWRAIFDTYLDELARLMDIESTALPSQRSHLRYVDPQCKIIGCGERVPIDGAYRDNFRSALNRRVELMFFHCAGLPDLTAHAPGGVMTTSAASPEKSGVHAPDLYRKAFLHPLWWDTDPPESDYTPKLKFLDDEDDGGRRIDYPEADGSETPYVKSPVEKEDWDHVSFSEALHPGYGGAYPAEKGKPG